MQAHKQLSLAISPCPNDIFIFSGIFSKKVAFPFHVNFSFASVDLLNSNAFEGTYDLSKVSLAQYNKINSIYSLLPVGLAFGKKTGPKLVSSPDTSYHKDKVIAVPGPSTTADFLVKQVLNHKQIIYLPFDKIIPAIHNKVCEMGVVIHESRLCLEKYELKVLCDLGHQWYKQTKLMLPLGGIVIKKTFPLSVQTLFCKALKDSIEYAYSHKKEVGQLMLQYSQEKNVQALWSHVHNFVSDDTHSLSKESKRCLQKFMKLL